jgi:hypothetical protein
MGRRIVSSARLMIVALASSLNFVTTAVAGETKVVVTSHTPTSIGEKIQEILNSVPDCQTVSDGCTICAVGGPDWKCSTPCIQNETSSWHCTEFSR